LFLGGDRGAWCTCS